ncbi:carbon-nitrogen hydrolase family protein [Kordiimonas aquimaris]|uniref:carbon-nitrogen hydrolase family protein n=1 Tax=Kordiimonas aquimaris TaxID=707591 RepID=UPI0021D26003|nr:carbon-nitrogen hydrolase family protein [Kordiimonas aquimaris]
MRIGLIQLNTGDEIGTATAEACLHIRAAAEKGAQFISTPETTHLMEMNRQAVLKKAYVEAADPGLVEFKALARELGVWLHIGSLIIKVDDSKLANRSFMINPDGEITARYDKIHLFDVDLDGGESYRESALYQRGESAVLTKACDTDMGMTICYDLRFAHLHRALAHAGAKIILSPAAFTKPTGAAHWHMLLRARAIETGCFVLAAAQTGMHKTGRETYGHSLVVNPWGDVIADAGLDVGALVVDLDLLQVDTVRSKIPALRHDQPIRVESM